MEELNDKQLYEQLKTVGHAVEKDERHSLESPFIDSIVGTLDYFGVGRKHLVITNTILREDRIKIYDYLGLCLNGSLDLPEDPISNRNLRETIRKLAKLYIEQKHVGGFGWWLRGHDLDIEQPCRCEDCIKSYDNWHNETPKQRAKAQQDLKKMFGGNVF